jgi:hypothetical protein
MPRDMAGSKHTSHADSVVQQGKIAVQLLGGISEATNIPYIKEIAGAALLLMDTFIVRFLLPLLSHFFKLSFAGREDE